MSSNDTHIFVDGIVAHRDGEPYVRITINGERAQLSIAEAKKIANDLYTLASRTEADAMIFRFFDQRELPPQAAAALMQDFRFFRQMQDDKPIDANVTDPESGERIK
jgi:hypothetical protein